MRGISRSSLGSDVEDRSPLGGALRPAQLIVRRWTATLTSLNRLAFQPCG